MYASMPGVLDRPSAAHACKHIGCFATTLATASRRESTDVASACRSACMMATSTAGKIVSGGPLRDIEIG
jgi:hypothetical protein